MKISVGLREMDLSTYEPTCRTNLKYKVSDWEYTSLSPDLSVSVILFIMKPGSSSLPVTFILVSDVILPWIIASPFLLFSNCRLKLRFCEERGHGKSMAMVTFFLATRKGNWSVIHVQNLALYPFAFELSNSTDKKIGGINLPHITHFSICCII